MTFGYGRIYEILAEGRQKTLDWNAAYVAKLAPETRAIVEGGLACAPANAPGDADGDEDDDEGGAPPA